MHWCGTTGLVVLLLTMVIALGTLFMLCFYDDSPQSPEILDPENPDSPL